MIYDADIRMPDGSVQHLEVVAADEYQAEDMITKLINTTGGTHESNTTDNTDTDRG
jgi:hypothetical protein